MLQEKYLDSIQGRIDLFTNAVQTMWQNTLDSGVVKWFIDLGTSIIKVIDSLGLIPSILSAIGLYKIVPLILKLVTHTNTFGVALATILKPLVQLKGSGQTLAQIFAQTAAGAMNAAGGVSTFSAYLKAAGTTLKAFISTPLGWFTIAAIAVGAVVGVVDLLTTSTKELEEELDNLNSEINNIKGEIDSLNSELETTRERMEELLALPSLSFTEQEELRNLQLQTAELERQLELNKLLLKSKEKERTDKAKEWANNVWDGDGTDRKYWVAGNGTIGEDLWWIPGVSGKEALETSLPKYEALKKEISDMENVYLSAKKQLDEDSGLSADTRKSIIDSANIKYPGFKSDEEIISELDDVINNNKDTLGRMETGINMVLGDMAKTISEYELSYSIGDEDINKFLDDYYAYSDAWNVAQGILAKSDVISNMFGTIASEEVQKLGESFREIANDENLSLDEQKSKIEGVIDNLNKENDAYNTLRTTMETVGVTAQDIADYFTLKNGMFDSDTVEGIAKQYSDAIDIMKQIQKGDPDKAKEFADEYNNAVNGNVDYNKRPIISSEKMKKVYPEFPDGETATTYDMDYGLEDASGNVAYTVKVTPILENGEVMTQEEIDSYVYDELQKIIDNGGAKEDVLEYDKTHKQVLINIDIGEPERDDEGWTALDRQLDEIKQKHLDAMQSFFIDGKQYNWDDFFSVDDEGKFEAKSDEFGEILKGMDENTREAFMNIAESVKNGEKSWDQAISSMNMSGMIASTKILENQWAEVNKTIFKSIDDGAISGWIDTFSELSAALEDVASSMDLLHSAQQQMNGSGRISIKTALELIEATDQWDQMLTITEGTIRLNANAEDVLVQSKLNVIKAQVDEALGAVELQLAQLGAADSAYTVAIASDVSDEAYEQYTNAMNSYSAAIAAFGAALDAAMSKRWGDIVSDFSSTYETAKKIANSSVDTSRIDRADLEKQRRDLQAQKNMLNQVGTVSSFKNNYDYEKTPGDKYEDKDKKTAKDLFDELAAEYDRKISTIEYKKDLIQSEIDKAEARGEVASEAFYQRQIELEEQNKQALINKKKALEDYLKAQGKNMTKEEWADAQEEINNTALAIEECEKNVIDLGQAIDDIHWEYFDKFTSEVDDLGDENSTLLSLVGDTDDAVDENGNWTASGVTQIGLNTQEMQRNLEMAKRMEKEKDRIQKSWNEYQRVLAKHGGDASKVTKKEKKAIQKKYGVLITSESEYQEKMQETSQKQRDYAKAAKDSKDAIEDLAKARVDKEVEAIEKEIDAYKELIDLKREELQSERDLHDFKKDVDKKTRDIGETQRKIASLSGSTDPADIALRRKLEAELRGQQEDLDETFYDHAKEAQLNALDEEAEAYEKSQNEKIKVLEKTLEDTETLITNAIMDMLINADTVLEQINTTAGLYGVSLSEELIAPWKDAAIKAGEYKEWIKTNIPNGVLAGVTDESGVITLFSNKMNEKINGPWGKAKTAVGNYVKYLGSKDVKNLPKLFTSWQTQIQNIANKWNKVKKAAEKAAKAQINAANVRVPKNQGKEEKTDPLSTSTQTLAPAPKPNPEPKMVKDGYIDADSILTFSSNSKDRIEKINGVSYAYDSDLKHYYDMRDGVLVNGSSQHATYRFSKPTTIYKKKYAKGTLGTKKDEWAIDSEPQHGDELVVVPNKGVLSYMRKGTSVIPANLTKNLMKWGKLNPNDKNSSRNVNLISNNVSKSEVKLNLGIDRLTNGNLSGLGKDVTDYIKDLTDSIKNTDELVEGTTKDTDKLIKETTKDTVDDSTNALKTISNMTDKYKSPISANLTTPWTNTTKKSKDFETGSKSNYDKVVQHINKYKGTLEMVLSKPYKNLTGDKKGNTVYEFLEYAKKTSINSIIDYAKKKSNSINTSLSKGFKGAKTSISDFSKSGTTAIDTLKDKFTNSKTGLIKALNDTTQAAENAKKAIENVPKYSGSSGGVGGKDIKALGGAVVPQFSYVSSPYGYRRDPKTGVEKFHGGTDFAAPGGSPIKAYADGIVKTAGYMANGYGNYVIIDHGSGNQTLYGHASRLHVKQGDQVKRGQLIADVGSTGYSTGNHLHFEYRKNGSVASPAGLPKFAKGTMGTKKDQWAVTDEPNFGDELKMYATPEGKLSFMRVGSTVVPADLTKELMDIADIGVDNLTMPKLNSDINLMSNYISKPELNISFDSMVHVDNCSQDTLKDLEKMVDSKINTFSRQLNYSLKRFSK